MSDDAGPSLEAAIDDSPEDTATFAVYADWLQRRGDPRGELIALALAADVAIAKKPARKPAAQTAYDKFFTRHVRTFLGPLAPHVRDGTTPFTWRAGFIARAELPAAPGRKVAPILRALLEHPSGRFVRELSLRSDDDDELAEIVALLAERAPGSLRQLELHTLNDLGSLDALWPALGRLQRLTVVGQDFDLGTLHLPALRRARFAATQLSGAAVAALGRAPITALETLELRFGSSGADLATFADLRPLLHRTDLPALAHLRLKRAAFAGAIVRELAVVPLARQLVVLDLSHGSFNPADIEFLVATRESFAALRELWLPLARLRDQDRTRALEIAKHVISDARSPQDSLEDDVRDRLLRTRTELL